MAWKVLKILGVFLASVAVLFVGAVFAVMIWPTIIVNPHTLEKAAEYAKPLGIEINWDDADVSSESISLFDKRLNFDFKNVCVNTKRDKFCFDDVEVRFRYSYSWFVPKLKEIGPVNLSGGRIRFESTEKEKEPVTGKLPIPKIKLPQIIRNLDFYPVSVQIEKFEYVDPGGTISGDLKLKAETDDRHLLKDINIVAGVKKAGDTLSADIKADIHSDSGFRKDKLGLKGDVGLTTPSGKSALKLEAEKDGKEVTFSTDFKHSKGGISLDGDLKGTLREDFVKGAAQMTMSNPSSPFPKIILKNCELKLESESARKNIGELNFNCSADFYIKKIDLPHDLDPIYEPPDMLTLQVSSKLETFFVPDIEQRTSGDVKLIMGASRSKLVETSGNMAIHLDGILKDFPKKMNMSADMDLDFKIHQFAGLVKILQKTYFKIPAPFNVLDGEIVFSLEGKIPSLQSLSSFPVELTTNLSAPNEEVDLDAEGEAKFMFNNFNMTGAEFDLDVDLTDVQIPLPDISLAGLPRLTPDSRIYLSEEDEKKAEKPSFIHYKLDLSTPQMTPLRLISNLAKEPVPIHLDLKGADGKYTGTISIDSFPLNLFRRNALVDRFNLELKDPAKYSVVSAKFTINVTEYQVFVLMEGTVERPRIWFESNPPLSESDIISVLLYGDTFDDLDSGNAQSVSSMHAAMANKAMALTTFFIFASTPIQTVGYNPETGALTAKIRLGEKTSLVVGTTKEKESSVGIRRRLGKGWLISTSLDKNPEDQTTRGTAFIEWHKRY